MKTSARNYAMSLLAAQKAGKVEPKKLVENLTQKLLKRGEIKKLPAIISALNQIEAEDRGVTQVVVETAREIPEKVKKQIEAQAEKLYPEKKIDARYATSPQLIAGYRIRGADKQIDASVQTKLKELSRTLTRI